MGILGDGLHLIERHLWWQRWMHRIAMLSSRWLDALIRRKKL